MNMYMKKKMIFVFGVYSLDNFSSKAIKISINFFPSNYPSRVNYVSSTSPYYIQNKKDTFIKRYIGFRKIKQD